MYKLSLCIYFLLLYLVATSQDKLKKIESLSSDKNEFAVFQDSSNSLIFFSRENKSGLPEIWESIHMGDSISNPMKSHFLDGQNWFGILGSANNSTGNYFFMGSVENSKGEITNGIFKFQRENNRWINPQQQNIAYFLNKSRDQSFCVSDDGNIMILSIQHYFSHGVEDLYVCFKEGVNTWSEPRNLGPVINTKFEEFTPFLDKDGRTLYFSSNGHPNGYGSKDIWVSYRLDDTWERWTTPKNLGNEVNTSGMETYFFKNSSNSDQFFVASTRTSNGQSDIYSIALNEDYQLPIIDIPKINTISNSLKAIESSIDFTDSLNILQIVIENKTTGKRIDGNIEVEIQDSTFSIAIHKDSVCKIFVNWNDSVLIRANADNYMPRTKRIYFNNERINLVFKEAILLDSLEKGKSIILQNVLFERGKPILLPGSNKSLEFIAEVMRNNPEFKIEIAGHTDNSGNAYLNQKLSDERAKAVKTWLISKQIDANRMSTIGFGGNKPIESNDSEATMKLNRRVEFRILD